ncbi:MAG: hypothetical protein FD153_1435 [Rhodospirillaceae bacterium]|nr:MAG: hypothetical protein FD153_1435 [Rhodospirillaceae bacterium]
MHGHALESYHHPHTFTVVDRVCEFRTLWVVFLTAVTMVVEVVTGWLGIHGPARGRHLERHPARDSRGGHDGRVGRTVVGDPCPGTDSLW